MLQKVTGARALKKKKKPPENQASNQTGKPQTPKKTKQNQKHNTPTTPQQKKTSKSKQTKFLTVCQADYSR